MIRIGNAGGYWGDDPTALKRQVEGGPLDFVSIDFLAEITMSIMQKQKQRDPSLGYAKDFIVMLKEVLETTMKNGTCIVTNAGGVNPSACAKAIMTMADEIGLKPKVAIVDNDDILDKMNTLEGCDFENMETGEKFSSVKDNIMSANIYFGASGVVKALEEKPDVIITGRVTDTGITLAPMIERFGWDTYDLLASGIVAGHIIECGTQATGGNITDWEKVDSFDHVGFPIIEMHENGEFVVTKHPGSGGLVDVDTVREQLFYEMGDPKAYITPDVIADFSTISLKQDGKDRVKVSGVKGFEPTPFYKVSMAYEDGYKSVGSIIICGPDARKKAEAFSKIFWNRVEGSFSAKETEYFGWNGCHKNLQPNDDGNEIYLRLGARSTSKEDLLRFGKLIPSLILSGPPGCAVTGGVAKPQNIVSYWPALMPKDLVYPRVAVYQDQKEIKSFEVKEIPFGKFEAKKDSTTQEASKISGSHKSGKTSLVKIAMARSGDKGDASNIGLIARSKEAYDFIDKNITAQVVKDLFCEHCKGTVTRYDVSNMQGFNFILEASLGGGGTKTLRSDAQGKTFSHALLRQKFDIPDSVLNSVKG